MDVIPVLDVRRGRVVHARGGARRRYRLVRGVLGTGDRPMALAASFRDRLGCPTVYLADLDAIAGRRPNTDLIDGLARLGLAVLVDGGIRDSGDAERLLAAGATAAVIGSETLESLGDLPDLARRIGPGRLVFSLDLRGGAPLTADPAHAGIDPVALAGIAVDAGIGRLLVLDLDRVGAGAGPPLESVRRIRSALAGVTCMAGGGVRGPTDLADLAAAGCSAALVATALHAGAIERATIEGFHAQAPNDSRYHAD